jgi:hypothetical protein
MVWNRLTKNPFYTLYSRVSNSYRAVKYSYLNFQGKMSFKLLWKPISVLATGAAVWYGNTQIDRTAKALNIDTKNRENMIKIFEQIDVDKSGQLDRNELRSALAKAGTNMSDFDLDALFKVADEDESGSISKEEWIKALQHKHDHQHSSHGKDMVKGAVSRESAKTAVHLETAHERGLDATPKKK